MATRWIKASGLGVAVVRVHEITDVGDDGKIDALDKFERLEERRCYLEIRCWPQHEVERDETARNRMMGPARWVEMDGGKCRDGLISLEELMKIEP